MIAAPVPSPRLLTTAPKVTVPVPAFRSRSNGPVNVLLNKMFPKPLPVSNATPPVRVVALLKVMSSLVVVISPAVLILPEPLVMLTNPSALMLPPAVIVTALVPLPEMVTVPPAVVVSVLSTSAIVP